MRGIVVAFSLVGMLMAGLMLPQSASAQAPTRSGFFIGFGFGAGSLGIEDEPDRETSVSGYLKLGGALNDKVLLGAESSAWVKEESGVTVTSGALNAVAYVYPGESGLFFQGGLGIATLEVDTGLFGSASETGTSLILGGGYDIGFGGRFGLTPYATIVMGRFDGGSTNVFNVGLGVNWY